MNTWEALGIAATQDEGAIRKAYAARVKQWRPDTHPQEFVQLRDAYERALHWARRAAREAAEEEAAALQEPAALPQDAPPSPEPGAVSQAPVEPPPATAADDAPAQAPAPHVLIRELAHCYSTRGEQQAVLLLREQLAAVSQQTIDARLDWEAVLLESFLAAETPPLALLFEGERLLGWRERGMDVTQMCGHEGAQRLLLLVEMAQEAAFLRFFSHNRWQRRLFGAVRVPWFGMANQVQAARATVQLWTRWAQEAGSPSLRQLLDARVLRRLGGLGLLSTDVLFALLAALLAWPEVQDAVFAQKRWSALAAPLLTFALVLPLPLLGRWLWETRPVRHVRGWRYLVEDIPLVIRAIVLGVLLVMGVIAWDAGPSPGVRIAGGTILAAAAAVLMLLVDVGAWLALRFAEQVLALPWLWLQRTWAVHDFRCVVVGGSEPRWRGRLAQLPSAVAAGWRAFRARRKARIEQQRLARQRAKAGQGRTFSWWWIFWGVFVLQALVRLAK